LTFLYTEKSLCKDQWGRPAKIKHKHEKKKKKSRDSFIISPKVVEPHFSSSAGSDHGISYYIPVPLFVFLVK
jgi:hypothetical protein